MGFIESCGEGVLFLGVGGEDGKFVFECQEVIEGGKYGGAIIVEFHVVVVEGGDDGCGCGVRE